ncbi:MAG: hypothetical protein D3913_07305 [Candidatus Electrothrix sp. LOE1_4_5]|nr:hypothetical protein [Candidatus Electrothrix gigas]MCI5197629.1 hypothetical protein [Candidatus Electrothrix gigas]
MKSSEKNILLGKFSLNFGSKSFIHFLSSFSWFLWLLPLHIFICPFRFSGLIRHKKIHNSLKISKIFWMPSLPFFIVHSSGYTCLNISGEGVRAKNLSPFTPFSHSLDNVLN